MERYLAINNVTVEQAIKALDQNAKKSDPMTIKVAELQETWFDKTDIDLEDVLDTYIPSSIVVLTVIVLRIIPRPLLRIRQVPYVV